MYLILFLVLAALAFASLVTLIYIVLTFVIKFTGESCSVCGLHAVVKGKTYDGRIIYLCSECLRGIRFREYDLFETLEFYDKNYKG